MSISHFPDSFLGAWPSRTAWPGGNRGGYGGVCLGSSPGIIVLRMGPMRALCLCFTRGRTRCMYPQQHPQQCTELRAANYLVEKWGTGIAGNTFPFPYTTPLFPLFPPMPPYWHCRCGSGRFGPGRFGTDLCDFAEVGQIC